MGAFNIVRVRWHNPSTGSILELNVQFKYGDTWQHTYQVGDVIRWGGNDIGEPGARHVVVDGCLDASVKGVASPDSFEVHVSNGVIEKVIPATGRFDFTKTGKSFIVLEE